MATPVFFVLYYYFDLNLRLSIPGGQEYWTYLYYIICFSAGFIAFRNVMTGAIFSLIESSINILLLLLSVMMPVVNLAQLPMENIRMNFGVVEIIHFFIAGSVLLLSFYSNPLISKHEA